MKDARRATIWLLVLLGVVVAGDRLFSAVLRALLVRSELRYSRLYRGGNRADVLILGDSRGVNSFYAPAIEELTGLRAFNLSYNSMSPRIAEAVLLDYLERNEPPRMVIIEPTCAIVSGALATELRTYGGFSPRLAALYAEQHPAAAAAGRVFRLYPLNSELYLSALHYMRRSDQDWIMRNTMPASFRGIPRDPWLLHPMPANLDALARIAALLRRRGIELRVVIAPYAPAKVPGNTAEFARVVEQRMGVRVWNYVGALDDLDQFADTVHLNEQGSRALLAMLVRDGAFGMARSPARF